VTSTGRKARESLGKTRAPGQYRFLHLSVIAILVTALLIGPITVLKLIIPTGPWALLPLIAFIVALEGGFTTWWLGKMKRRVNPLFYRISEIVLLLVALRLITWFVAGNRPNLATIRSFVINPSLVVDITFVLFILLAFFAWERSITFSSTFNKLTLSAEEIVYYSIPTSERFQSGITGIVPKNRIHLHHDFLRQWVIGGIILIIFTVITTFDLPEPSAVATSGINIRNIGRLGLRSDILLALILYFIGGLWLASLGRMHILQARWLTTRLPADVEIVRSWRTRGLILLLLLALVAAFMPIGSSFAFSRIIAAILSLIAIAFGLLFTLLAYLLYIASSLFGSVSPKSPPAPVDLSQFARATDLTESSSEVPALIFGSIFWIGIITIVIIALLFFLRDRGITVKRTQLRRPWQVFIAWICNLWKKVNRQPIALSLPWRNRLKFSKPLSDDQILPWRFLRINSLTPRDQIFYFYLSIVKRAGKKGVSRAPNMTPSEYATKLESAWPEARSDIQYLTGEFQEARYSADPIDKDKLSTVRGIFRRLRSMLRQRKVEY